MFLLCPPEFSSYLAMSLKSPNISQGIPVPILILLRVSHCPALSSSHNLHLPMLSYIHPPSLRMSSVSTKDFELWRIFTLSLMHHKARPLRIPTDFSCKALSYLNLLLIVMKSSVLFLVSIINTKFGLYIQTMSLRCWTVKADLNLDSSNFIEPWLPCSYHWPAITTIHFILHPCNLYIKKPNRLLLHFPYQTNFLAFCSLSFQEITPTLILRLCLSWYSHLCHLLDLLFL